MNKKKKNILPKITFLASIFTVAVCSTTAVLGVFCETEIIKLQEKSFSATYDGYTYNCYIIDDSEHKIAIGWGQDPSTTPNTDSGLSLPSSLTKPGTQTPYEVTAIATAGFRYCDFKAVTVPNTVTLIGEEAFAYCDKLTSFSMPYGVTEIKAGTFMDCRALTKLTYRDSQNNASMYNYKITSIGDHAFDSCISIINFNCPSNVVSFGKSCFQNCNSLASFSFPQGDSTNSNRISVGSYAFADCSSLIYVYFEENMYSIADYAFADCDDTLAIDYTGNSIPSFSTYWRRRYLAKNRNNSSDASGTNGHLIKINTKTPIVRKDLRFPGLKYSVVDIPEGSSVKLDWGYSDTPVTLITGPRRFAQITGFDAPTAVELSDLTDGGSYYYTISSNVRTLIIPDQVKDPAGTGENDVLDVLTINGTGFKNKTSSELTAIIFNESLVQISHEVFLGCSGLTSINFTKCKHLREIGYRAFQNCTKIEAIHLPYSLEYIADWAFNKCKSVEDISFTVNNELFQNVSGEWKSVSGTFIRGVAAPTSSEGLDGNYYIDTYHNKAYKKDSGTWTPLANQSFGSTEPSGGNNNDYYIAIPRLKVIGWGAFRYVGWDKFKSKDGTVNLVLPESLNDQDAVSAKINHSNTFDDNSGGTVLGKPTGWNNLTEWNNDHSHFREVAIGRHAFDATKCLATVEMAEAIGEHKTNKSSLDYTCSLGTSAFARCHRLLRFQASENFYTIGASCFNAKDDTNDYKGCRLKEVFLSSYKACNESCQFNYPFAIGNSDYEDSNGDNIAIGGVQKDLVIYVSGGIPGDLENYSHYKDITNTHNKSTPNTSSRWNAESSASYTNEYGVNSYRSHIPTYWNVDWQASDGVLYWKTSGSFASKPKSTDDYKDSRIVFVREVGSSDYIAAKFFYNKDTATTGLYIDLSKIPTANSNIPDASPTQTISANAISDNLKTIGSCSFASDKNSYSGMYYVLPNCVERIEERAFYNNVDGVRIVTYRDSDGKIVKSDGTKYADDSAFTTDRASAKYCTLSDNVEFIGRDAFYNNAFKSVYIGSGLIANGFDTTPFCVNAITSITSITMGNNGCDLSVDTTTKGLYYESGGTKILVYQPAGATANGTLNIVDGTNAIARLALAKTNYQTVNIPDSVTTLYGGCFQNSTNLKTIDGGEGIKYINASAKSPDTEVWNSNMPFGQFDYNDVSNSTDTNNFTNSMTYYSFSGCKNLSTINLKAMTSLVKIGKKAFDSCTSLSNMTGGVTYDYSYANDGTNGIILEDKAADQNAGVLDLSDCSHLTNIEENAFNGCTSLKYVHTPQTALDNYNSTTISYGSTCLPNNSIKVLVGDTSVTASGIVGGLQNSSTLFFHVTDAVMIKTTAPDNSYGKLNSFYIYLDNGTPKLYQKGQSEWSQITSGLNISTNAPSGSNYTYWIKKSSSNYILYKKNASNKWAVVGDIKEDEEDDGAGTYSSPKRSYWTYDSTYGYIFFWNSGGLTPAKLVKEYFYYGVVS